MTGNNPSLPIERWFNKLQYTIDYCADIKRNDDSRYIPLSSDIPGILLIQKEIKAQKAYMVHYQALKKMGRGEVRIIIYVHVRYIRINQKNLKNNRKEEKGQKGHR